MALILNIDSSTDICSVAIAINGQVLELKESRDKKSHAALLAVFIEELAARLNINLKDLDAVAVSMGPGSYTGLRIGVSTAKGIAYGTGIKLIGIPTLQALAYRVAHQPGLTGSEKNRLLCPMIDARRMEVFTALYTTKNELYREITAEIIYPGIFSDILEKNEIWFFGNGSGKCKNVIRHPNARFIEGIEPSAAWMADLSEKAFMEKKFEDIAYFEPFYLKDFIATIPKKNILPTD